MKELAKIICQLDVASTCSKMEQVHGCAFCRESAARHPKKRRRLATAQFVAMRGRVGTATAGARALRATPFRSAVTTSIIEMLGFSHGFPVAAHISKPVAQGRFPTPVIDLSTRKMV